MRIRTNVPVKVHPAGDPRRPVGLQIAGLIIQMTRSEAHRLADQLHDQAEKEKP